MAMILATMMDVRAWAYIVSASALAASDVVFLDLNDFIQGFLGCVVFGARCSAHLFDCFLSLVGSGKGYYCCVFLYIEIPMILVFLV